MMQIIKRKEHFARIEYGYFRVKFLSLAHHLKEFTAWQIFE